VFVLCLNGINPNPIEFVVMENQNKSYLSNVSIFFKLPPALAGGLFNIVKIGFSRTILAKAYLDYLI
jgi:hypothetical protein